MDYRDERDALRARLETLEQDLEAARRRADEAGRLEHDLAAKEKEIAKLRAALGPKPPRNPARIAILLAGAAS
ncbi:MAG TPA: hypothetical protein VHB21_09760, partial [Minicystis sp.]|nr:hypothetical protein [Minicystis sp.]